MLKSIYGHVFFILLVRTKQFVATLSPPTEISPKDSQKRLQFAVDSTALASCFCIALNQLDSLVVVDEPVTTRRRKDLSTVKVEERCKEKLVQLNLGKILNELVSD